MRNRSLLILATLCLLGAACGEEHPSGQTTATLSAAFSTYATYSPFSVINTHYANRNTANFPLYLKANEGVVIGTCGVKGASTAPYPNDDTYLRLYTTATPATEATFSDQACDSNGSRIIYVAPTAGTYEIRAGCWADMECGGTVAVGRATKVFSYSAMNTSNATLGYYSEFVQAAGGQRLTIGTCDLPHATRSGDTYLRLYDLSTNTQVAENNNGTGLSTICGAGSKLTFDVPLSGSGYYEVRAGCAGNQACGGTVSVVVE
jgi:lysyl endopeptidase